MLELVSTEVPVQAPDEGDRKPDRVFPSHAVRVALAIASVAFLFLFLFLSSRTTNNGVQKVKDLSDTVLSPRTKRRGAPADPHRPGDSIEIIERGTDGGVLLRPGECTRSNRRCSWIAWHQCSGAQML